MKHPDALPAGELSVESFCVRSKSKCQRHDVNQSEREEAEVDSLFKALLEEHGHVDAVGGEADEEEDRDEDGGLDSVKKLPRLKTDEVVGVVPRDGRVYTQDDAVFCDIAR